MKKSFKSLDLNKKTIAKLSNEQMGSLKGGKADTVIINCNVSGATVVKTKIQ